MKQSIKLAPRSGRKTPILQATTLLFALYATTGIAQTIPVDEHATGNQDTGETSTAVHGIGLQQRSFSYQQSQVPLALWYPTVAAPIDIDAGPFTLHAASDATFMQHRHALVVISHGTGGSNIAHHSIAEALAKAGYMVAALEHPGDNYKDRSLLSSERYFSQRPHQLAALLQALTSDPKLNELIDVKRLGAIGHSVGGYTVAAALGAQPDRQSLVAHCQRVTDDPSCQYRDPSIGVTSPTDSPFVPQEDTQAASGPVPTLRSAVLLAPLGSPISPQVKIPATTPLLIIAAQHDQVLPHQYHLQRLKTVAPHATTRIAAGAGHFSFIAPINESWQSELGEVAEDPDGFDRVKFNQQLGRELVSWFNKTLQP